MEAMDQFHDLSLVLLRFVLISLVFIGSLVLGDGEANKSLAEHNFLETVWTVWPVGVLLRLGLPSLALLYSCDESKTPLVRLRVTGHQWYWAYSYPELRRASFDAYIVRTNPKRARLLEVDNRVLLPLGVRRALVTRRDVLHAWALSSLGVKADATPGRVNQIRLGFIKRGVVYGQCSELCGPNHRFMPIVLERLYLGKRRCCRLLPSSKWGV